MFAVVLISPKIRNGRHKNKPSSLFVPPAADIRYVFFCVSAAAGYDNGRNVASTATVFGVVSGCYFLLPSDAASVVFMYSFAIRFNRPVARSGLKGIHFIDIEVHAIMSATSFLLR